MEYPNDNMEEFFKNSLDRFDELPSDEVWVELDNRLDNDKPLGFLANWFKFLVLAAFLVSGFSFIYYKQNQLLKEYKIELSSLVGENDDLKQKLALGSSDIKDTKLKQEIPLQQNIRRQQNAQTIPERQQQRVVFQANNTSQFKLVRDTVFIIKYVENTFSQLNHSLAESNTTPFASGEKAPFSILNYPYKTSASNNIFESDYTQNKNSPNVLSSHNNLSNRIVSSNIPIPDLIGRMKFNSISKSKRKKKKHKPYEGPVMIDLDPWGQPEFSYRVGVSISLLNSLIGEQFSNSSIGFGYGLIQEIGLSTRFAVTSGINKNSQEYALSNNGLPLELSQIGTFPNQENFNESIIRVEVENEFYEIPVGVKYNFYVDNQKSFFINPSVKWSIHKPQQFNYFLTENRIQTFSSERRFGYLNAINLSIGVEKIINPLIRYQLSLGYDHSLTEVGVEKQRLNTLFLKGNVLFGK